MTTGVITTGAGFSGEDPLEALLRKLGLSGVLATLPTFSGAEDPDDDADEDDDDSSDEDDDDDQDDDDDESDDASKSKKSKTKAKGGKRSKAKDDDDDDDDADDPLRSKNKEVRKIAEYAAKKRKLAKKRQGTIEQQNETIDDLRSQLKDKQASGDKKLNQRIKNLETERDEAVARAEKAEGKVTEFGLRRQVAKAAKGLNVKESEKFVLFALKEADMMEVEDGEIEDLDKNIKRLIKRGELSVVESSDDDDDDNDDEDKSLTRGGSRSGKSMKGKRSNKNGKFDRAALEEKYPALRR